MQKSLWQDTCSLPSFKKLENDIKTDVLIIGGGMAGMVLGIIIGIVGFIGCGVNYPIYKKKLEKGKAKYAYEIVELARQISEQ